MANRGIEENVQTPLWWFSDFGWENRQLVFRQTGVRVRLDRNILVELGHWVVYLFVLGVAALAAALWRAGGPRGWFAPVRPRPWYLARGAALWSGVRAARIEAEADVAFYFEDVTRGEPPRTALRQVNSRCTDISKSHVARVFDAVFGYPLTLDPETAAGPIVEKSEKNGVHDGRILEAPLTPRAGCVYQRLVDTSDRDGHAHDLRTLCAEGRPLLIWVKQKPAGARFSINNTRASLRRPQEIYTPAEIADIGVFCARIGLDWGGLDILRDRHDGRIYIVDVNKTDLGPVIALSWADKIRSMQRLGAAFRHLVLTLQSAPPQAVPQPAASGLPARMAGAS